MHALFTAKEYYRGGYEAELAKPSWPSSAGLEPQVMNSLEKPKKPKKSKKFHKKTAKKH